MRAHSDLCPEQRQFLGSPTPVPAPWSCPECHPHWNPSCSWRSSGFNRHERQENTDGPTHLDKSFLHISQGVFKINVWPAVTQQGERLGECRHCSCLLETQNCLFPLPYSHLPQCPSASGGLLPLGINVAPLNLGNQWQLWLFSLQSTLEFSHSPQVAPKGESLQQHHRQCPDKGCLHHFILLGPILQTFLQRSLCDIVLNNHLI